MALDSTNYALLSAIGVPPGIIERLAADHEAILCLDSLSIAQEGDRIICFDHAVPMDEPCDLAEHQEHFKRLIEISVGAGQQWSLLSDEPVKVAVMYFEVDDEFVA